MVPVRPPHRAPSGEHEPVLKATRRRREHRARVGASDATRPLGSQHSSVSSDDEGAIEGP